ncbi:MAG: hypothetical protein HUN04_05420 [Desulfobacter sp.]|nr:MAG: hypothetical protein HUN04_05420 [Desulfobacter sp.]
MGKKKDVIEEILDTDDKEFESDTRELDCLIYKASTLEELEGESGGKHPAKWKASVENVSVEIWESRAKIKVKVGSRGAATRVSMRKLANIAVDAIVAELKKEGAK